MDSINITGFRKNIYTIMEQTVKYNEPVNIITKSGNAVVMSESDYLGLMETLYLVSIPDMRRKLIEGKDTPLNETLSEDEVQW